MSITEKYALTFRIKKQGSAKTLTSTFRSPGRQKRHSLEQRMVRDFHDLDYGIHQKNTFLNIMKKSHNRRPQPKPQLPSQPANYIDDPEVISFKIPANPSHIQRSNSLQCINPSSYSKIQLLENSSGLDQTRNSFGFSKGMRSTDTGFFKVQKTQTSGDFGLSPFEKQETILGKIQKRQSHHLNFGKKPERPQNLNKVWYSKFQSISALDTDKNSKLHKIHSFKSNLPHNVFKPAENLDKFYDQDPGLKLLKFRSDTKVRKIQGYNPRPEIPKKEGTQLDYPKNRSLMNNKKPIFQISKSARKLKIMRQVISPERGCYR